MRLIAKVNCHVGLRMPRVSNILAMRLRSAASLQASMALIWVSTTKWHQIGCDPSAQLDLPLIEQATQSLHRSLLSPGEAILLAQQPVDLSLGDHPGTQALKEQLTSGHRLVTKLLHPGCWAGLPRALGPLVTALKHRRARAGMDVRRASHCLMRLAMIDGLLSVP